MKIRTVCVLGGTGFVGRHLVARLANSGRAVKVLSRRSERHRALRVLPNLMLVEADIHEPEILAKNFTRCDAVINLVGILNGSSAAFRGVHVELPKRVVKACKEAGVKRLLHMSALNADAVDGPSDYLRSKGEGEQVALAAGEDGIAVTSFRPSVIFGPDDSFFNRFAGLLRVSPLLPLACPYARFAPVYVADLIQAFEQTLEDKSVFGEGLEICGPKVYTLKELVEYTARLIARKRLIIGLPDSIARIQGRILQHFPGQPFTMDNFHSLQMDSVCRSDGLARLGIAPHSVEAIMPTFFSSRTREGRYRRFRQSAGRK